MYVKHWDAIYDDTGHHFPGNLNETQQVTQQVYLLGMWDFVEGLERKTILEGETIPHSCPQKRLWLGSLIVSPLLSPIFCWSKFTSGLLIVLYSLVLGRGASVVLSEGL